MNEPTEPTAVDIAKTEWEARARKAAKSSPQGTVKAGTIIDLPQETAPDGIVNSLDEEVEEFRKKVAHWEKVLSSADSKKLLETIGRIIGAKLIVLAKTQAAAA